MDVREARYMSAASHRCSGAGGTAVEALEAGRHVGGASARVVLLAGDSAATETKLLEKEVRARERERESCFTCSCVEISS